MGGFSLLYLIFDRWFIYNLVDYFEDTFDITLYTHIKSMVRYHVSGEDMSTPTVLFTCLIDQSRWMLLWASVVHFKVGLWRIFGYNVDPHFNRPWLATNLANFWARYAFHFRAFLVSAFYYPVFLRFFKKNLHLRVFVATMAAACVGNMIWGHMSENLFYEGLEWEYIVDYLPRWPYFLLLGLAISLVQVYLLRKKRNRKPWTWGVENRHRYSGHLPDNPILLLDPHFRPTRPQRHRFGLLAAIPYWTGNSSAGLMFTHSVSRAYR